jgi:putative transcriptional regulator
MKMPNSKIDQTDWAYLAGMTDEEAEANALSDPDNPPLTSEQLQAAPRMPQVKVIRRAFGLTQEEFAARYQIPLGTLRDWEQGRSVPDQTAKAYLKVIARNPDGTAQVLAKGAA